MLENYETITSAISINYLIGRIVERMPVDMPSRTGIGNSIDIRQRRRTEDPR